MEHTTDEMMGPTRGTDWSDFGCGASCMHTPGTRRMVQVLGTWNDLNAGSSGTTQVIDAPLSTARQVARPSFLRAFFAFYVMDLYGQVPIRPLESAAPSAIPTVMQRPAAFDSSSDLRAARPQLPPI